MAAMRKPTPVGLIGLLVGALVIVACRPSGEKVAPAAPPPTAGAAQQAAEGKCGDGVCDDAEQANPRLCPQDCEIEPSPVPATATLVPSAAPPTAEPTLDAAVTKSPADRCGDGVCDEVESKNPGACPQDCAEEPTPTSPPTAAAEASPVPTAEVVPAGQTTTSPGGGLAMIGNPSTIDQQSAGSAEPPQSNVAFILDASGSMTENLPGEDQTKLAVAKEVLAEVIPQIPSELNGSLWIYGHRHPGDPKSESCKDIEQVYPLGPVDAQTYVDTIMGITALGWTPISDSIQQAAENLPVGDFNSIILVSDGEETCGGNPCALAEALKASDAELTIHVVGYAVDDETQEQLQCIAAVSGGSYHDATDAAGLLQALEDALAATIVETSLRVEIALPDGTEADGTVWLYEAGTDRVVSIYQAWTDNLVPPGTYDLLVGALPDLMYHDLALPEGSTTIVRVTQGAIAVLNPEHAYIPGEFYEASTNSRLGTYGHEGPVALSPGTYYVRVTNSTSVPVRLEAGQLVEMVMGTVTVRDPQGEVVAADIFDAATDQRLGHWGADGPVELLPGTYYVQANNSTSEPIALSSGAAEEFLLGSITVRSPDDEVVAAVFFEAPDGKRLGSYGRDGAVLLVPGSYYLGVNGSTSEPIVLAAGAEEEVRLGAIQVDGSFVIWTEDGQRLGGYSDTMLLVPATYNIELADGTKVEGITVQPGQVTVVD